MSPTLPRRYFRSAILLAAVLAAVAVFDGRAASSSIKNFKLPGMYPGKNQLQWFLTSAEAEPRPNGVYLIKVAKVETYRENGEKEMIFEAPECLFDRQTLTATSAGPVQVRSADGRLTISGEG